MKPVMIHADDTDCDHEGPPQMTVEIEGGPRCAANRPVTHIRFHGQVLTVEEALHTFHSMAESFAQYLIPVVTELAVWGKTIVTELLPAARALAAAAEVFEEERARETAGS